MNMWPFGSNKTIALFQSGMLDGFEDWHSHILPGVDDGIRSLDESLEVLRHYEEWGIRKVWLTPHIMEDYPNTPGTLHAGFQKLCEAWNGNVELALASENMLDSLFSERLEADDIIPIGDGKRNLLVETSYFSAPMALADILDRIRAKGYFPVLAHPERYRYMDKDDYRKLRNDGVLFQLNLLSLTGVYGPAARKMAIWMIKEGMVDLFGSDLHNLASFMSGAGFKSSDISLMEKALSMSKRLE